MNQEKKGIFYYLAGCFVLTILLITVKKISQKFEIGFEQIIFMRQLLICIILLPFMIKDKVNLFNINEKKTQIKRHGLFVISTIFWYKALILSSVNDIMGIASITPVIATFFSIKFLNEKPKKGLYLSSLICLIGVLIIKKPSLSYSEALDNLGYLFAIITVLIRSYIPVLNKKISNNVSLNEIMYVSNIFMLSCFSLFFYKFKPISYDIFPYILVIAICFFAEYYLMSIGYKYVNSSTLQPLDFSKPIFTIAISYLVLNEKPTFEQILGILMIVIGYFYLINKNRK